MVNFRQLILILVVVASIAGCGGYRDKGINEDKDKPKPVPQEPAKNDE